MWKKRSLKNFSTPKKKRWKRKVDLRVLPCCFTVGIGEKKSAEKQSKPQQIGCFILQSCEAGGLQDLSRAGLTKPPRNSQEGNEKIETRKL